MARLSKMQQAALYHIMSGGTFTYRVGRKGPYIELTKVEKQDVPIKADRNMNDFRREYFGKWTPKEQCLPEDIAVYIPPEMIKDEREK